MIRLFDRLPTTDLYVLNPLAELKRRSTRLPRLKRVAKNLYTIGRTGIVVRYGRAEDVERLRRAGATQIVYVADDDFSAGATDLRLPARYRERLSAFAEGAWPALREAADIVVVPGSVLAESYGAKARIVPPLWHLPSAPLGHFGAVEQIEVAHFGTASHLADLEEIASPLADALTKCGRRVRLTLFSGAGAPAVLARHPRVRVRAPMSWRRYRRALSKMRFHLALYPLGDTPFNRSRSASKFYEHAIVGAASLMAPNAALRDAAGEILSDIFVEDGDWGTRLNEALADLDSLRRRAERTRTRIAAADSAGEAARRWAEILADDL